MTKLIILLIVITQSMYLGESEINSIKKISNKHEKSQAFTYYYNNSFKKYLNQADLTSKKGLGEVIQVFFEITFYVENKDIVRDYLTYFNQYEKKGWAQTNDVQNMFQALIRSREFTKAAEFYSHHQDIELEKIPYFIDGKGFDEHGIILFAVDRENKNTLIRQNLNFSKSAEIVIISHPICHFCNRAAIAINSDQELSQIFANHAQWLIPPDSRFYLDAVNQWNSKFPNFTMKYIEKSSDFTMLDYWGTPTFYFLKDGSVVDKVVGWPKEGNINKIKSFIAKYKILQ